LQAAIQKHTDEGDEWNGPLQTITISKSAKIIALRASVQHHLKGGTINAERKVYYIALHHWSRSLLATKTKKGHRTTFLRHAEAERFDEADNHGRRHAQNRNLVLVIMKKVNYELDPKQEQAFKNKFVQAPTTSYEDVSTFVKALSSTDSLNRLDRISKRQKISLENSKQLSHAPLSLSSSSSLSSNQLQVPSADADLALNDKCR
jgi:hypothetical protein